MVVVYLAARCSSEHVRKQDRLTTETPSSSYHTYRRATTRLSRRDESPTWRRDRHEHSEHRRRWKTVPGDAVEKTASTHVQYRSAAAG